MPLKLHIGSIRKEMDDEGNLTQEDTLRYTNEQIDKFIKF
jgi:chromate reductase